MKTKTDRQPHEPTPAHSAPLKGSDFFPPGAGWNKSKNPQAPESLPDKDKFKH